MKATIYKGNNKVRLEERPKPEIIEPTDVVLKMVKSTICGTDLHILKGDVPTCLPGTTLGHEGIGTVESVGPAVKNFKKGDTVLLSCVTSCSKCDYCKRGLYSQCRNGGWILGHRINGVQADYVRIPMADSSLYHFPKDANTDGLVMVSDTLPTGHEIGALSGAVKPGDNVVIIGAGPIGMAAMLTCLFYSPGRVVMVDRDPNRLAFALKNGATDTIDSAKQDPVAIINEMFKEEGGADVVVEAVGVPATFDVCQKTVRPGGHIASVGVFNVPVSLELEKLWIKNITLTTGLVNTNTMPMLLKTVAAGRIKPEKLVTHHFKFAEIEKAYRVFGNAAKEKAMKVIIDF